MSDTRPFLSRRGFLALVGVTPFVSVRSALLHGPRSTAAATEVFPLSVASGDPSPSGVVLWTRVAPGRWQPTLPLSFEVARDGAFLDIVEAGVVEGSLFGAERDFTVKIDLDGRLGPDSVYFYRFMYDGVTSRTGRCRTLPAVGSQPAQLRLAVVSCQDFLNGYYGAFAHLASEDVAFVLHLGDFIYEGAGQSGDYADRAIVLPSGGSVAMSLDDFRHLYRTYRSDPFLQLALERHTWISQFDDHETANDAYWDYPRDTLGAPDHPFSANGGDPTVLRGLKLAAQRAWSEYVPARVALDEGAAHPHDFLSISRRFSFGDLADVFMTDERTYRSAPPCGIDDRVASEGCPERLSPDRTMLGGAQRDWLVQQVASSPARWKLWANAVLLAQLKFELPNRSLYATLDSWDGFPSERASMLGAWRDAGVENLVVLTGDLHSYLASYVKIDYDNRSNIDGGNVVGVELMAPAVTSANFKEIVQGLGGPNARRARTTAETQALFEGIIRLYNPHVRFFNSEDWGYVTVDLGRRACVYTAYAVDKTVNSANAPKRVLARFLTPSGRPRLLRLA